MSKSIVRSIRTIEVAGKERHILSLSCTPAMMPIADQRSAYNLVTGADGETRTYRPDVTLFVTSPIAAAVDAALADGKSLAVDVTDAIVTIDQSAKGTHFIKGELVIADPKHLRFSVTTPQTATFEESAPGAHADSEDPGPSL